MATWLGFGGRLEGMKWASWCSICCQTMHGGLGFRDFNSHNRALLSKQSWLFLVLDRLDGRNLLLQNLRWHVGSGFSVHITGDIWLPTTPPSRPWLLPNFMLQCSHVSSLIDHSERAWRLTLLQSLFDSATIEVFIRLIKENNSAHSLRGAIMREVHVLRSSLQHASFHFVSCRYIGLSISRQKRFSCRWFGTLLTSALFFS